MAYKISDDCISCGACQAECPVSAISEGDGKYEIDADTCIECGACNGVCPVDVYKRQPSRRISFALPAQTALPSTRASTPWPAISCTSLTALRSVVFPHASRRETAIGWLDPLSVRAAEMCIRDRVMGAVEHDGRKAGFDAGLCALIEIGRASCRERV